MRFIEQLRRPDWLGELQTALVAALTLLGVMAVVNVAAIVGGSPVSVQVPAGAVGGVGGATGGLAAGVAVDPDGTVDVLVSDPTVRQGFAAALVSLPTFVVILALFAMLLGVVRRARRGGPFDGHVVRRLRLIGMVAIVAGVLAGMVELVAQLALTSTVTDRSISATLSLQRMFSWVLVGVASFAIAEVVKRGLAMRAELATVI
ncbi:MAG TPA: DUF2975 domain-containing protein [Catenuloplanes sp.]|jgi:hypothetical protein